jgi:hypothetical protein
MYPVTVSLPVGNPRQIAVPGVVVYLFEVDAFFVAIVVN